MATMRKIKVTLTVREKGEHGPFKIRKRTVSALNRFDAEHLVKRQARKECLDVGVVLESTSMIFTYSTMVRRAGTDEQFVPANGKVNADTEADVPAAVQKELGDKGFEVGTVFNIKDLVAH